MNSVSDALFAANPVSGRRFPASRMANYLKGGHRSVDGWLTPLSASVLAHLLDEQSRFGVKGSVGEIGVHHGKLFLVAYLSTRSDEAAFAIDVFEQQQFNVDHSGKGDRERFLDNVRRHGGSTDGLVVIASDSLKITPEEIRAKAGAARFVSVDGGHTEECTRNDLALADSCLVDGGIILLDDYFNHHWPDVSVGAARHFTSPTAKTKPFLITPNKVFFAEPRYHAVYQKATRARFGNHYTRSCKMFGAAVDIYVFEGLRSLGRSVSGLITDEARIRLSGYPAVTRLIKTMVRR